MCQLPGFEDILLDIRLDLVQIAHGKFYMAGIETKNSFSDHAIR